MTTRNNVMENIKAIPLFTYDISYKDNKSATILTHHTVYDSIKNTDEFLRALGYTDEIRARKLLPDEFVWDIYSRAGSAKTPQCLQSKITEYLINHSERFRKEYGVQYVHMMGKCILDQMDDSDICIDCPMHPRFLY